MNTEHFIKAETEGSSEAVRLKNEIQIALTRRYFDRFDVSSEQLLEWLTKYSERFHHIFDRMIKTDPHFWMHDQETRNATLDLFEDELYSKTDSVNPERVEEEFEK